MLAAERGPTVLEPEAGRPDIGVDPPPNMMQSEALTEDQERVVYWPVAIDDGEAVNEDIVGEAVAGIGANVAETEASLFNVIVQDPVPEQSPPLQPVKLLPLLAIGLKVRRVPAL